MSQVNEFLDSLPRTRIFRNGRELPAFLAAGMAGFYAAVTVAMGAALATGRSVATIVVLSCAGAASFYGWAWLRRWIAGKEKLVLLEHVWLALAVSGVALWAIREPVLPYLDIESIALGVFLAFGRLGCTLAGCCHGQASSVGIVCGDAFVPHGFPAELAGVRLFPVAALEMFGLVAIVICGAIALPFSPPGRVLAWFLLAYAILRSALESFRGDARPHLLGLSVPRWMAMTQAVAVLFWLESGRGGTARYRLFGLAALLIAAVFLRIATDRRARVLNSRHVREIRNFVAARMQAGLPDRPEAWTSSRGVTAAISQATHQDAANAHVSLSLPGGRRDLPVLCELAARALPELQPEATRFGGANVLHCLVPAPLGAVRNRNRGLHPKLYGIVVRALQQTPRPSVQPEAGPVQEEKPAAAVGRPWRFPAIAGRQ
jgi:hypothetical protein